MSMNFVLKILPDLDFRTQNAKIREKLLMKKFIITITCCTLLYKLAGNEIASLISVPMVFTEVSRKGFILAVQ